MLSAVDNLQKKRFSVVSKLVALQLKTKTLKKKVQAKVKAELEDFKYTMNTDMHKL